MTVPYPDDAEITAALRADNVRLREERDLYRRIARRERSKNIDLRDYLAILRKDTTHQWLKEEITEKLGDG